MRSQGRNNLLACLLVVLGTGAQAQVNFEGTKYYFNNSEVSSFIPKVVHDINGDYRDDVMVVDGDQVSVYVHSQSNDSLYKASTFREGSAEPWAQGVADFANDGEPEMFYSGYYDGLYIYRKNGNSYTLGQQLSGNFFAQAFSIADIDNDGFLDLFICHDDGLSKVYLNDGSGILVDNSDYIDMRTTPQSDNSGNYSSAFSDIDNDGDLDLYIGKCRLGVSESTDPRRINALFVNQGDGTFLEAARDRGVASGAQSWSVDYGDFNRDGYQDIVVLNHDFRNQLFINDGTGSFVEDMNFGELVPDNGTGYQVLVADFDNNGWEDVMIAGTRAFTYYNMGNMDFQVSNPTGGITQFNSGAFGDINSDGFLDIYGGSNGLGGGNAKDDLIYVNQGNSNNHLVISLEGTVSNRQGIGAMVKVYTASGVQCRFSKAGVSYSIQNTMNQHFGLGLDMAVDSVVVSWPSGIVDVLTDVEINQQYLIIEGGCAGILPVLSTTEAPFLCDGEAGSLDILSGTPDIDWSTGETGSQITVSSAGIYSAQSQDCDLPSNSIVIHSTPTLAIPILNQATDIVLCEGAEVEVAVLNYPEVTWQDGSNGESITVTSDAIVQATLVGSCNNAYSTEVNVSFVSQEVDSDRDTALIVGERVLSIPYVNANWYGDAEATMLLGVGSELAIELTQDTQFYFQLLAELQPPTTVAGFDLATTDVSPNFFNENGLMYFRPQKDFTLRSVSVEALEVGVRDIILINSTNQEIERVSVDLQSVGPHTIELGWSVEQGKDYRLTTDSNVNSQNFGDPQPQFGITFNPGFPLVFDTWVTLTNSSFPSIYFFFYDWVIEEAVEACDSEIYSYTVSATPSGVADSFVDRTSMTVSPNPSSNNVKIKLEEETHAVNIQIFNALGKQILRGSMDNDLSLDIANWPTGKYIVQGVTEQGKRYTTTFIKE